MKSLLEFDDAGAQDDEPTKGVTVGDIRAWHDEIERLRLALAESDALIATHADKIDSNRRPSWPKGSLLAAALDRHSARLLALTLQDSQP